MAFSIPRGLIALASIVAVTSAATVGCSVIEPSADRVSTASTQASSAPWGHQSAKTGAQLWTETCLHCHNLRSPASYSAAQWQVALHDMRVRGNLTGDEQCKILAFMLSAR
jgi:cytochrome c5